MRFQARIHSTFWDVLVFDDVEVETFFPKTAKPRYRLKDDRPQIINPSIRILRQDIYEWCLDHFGPEFYMDHLLERVFYDHADLPDMTLARNKKLKERRFLTHRWCIADSHSIAFTDSKDAMLFKLTWGGITP